MAKKEWKRVEGLGNNGDVFIEEGDTREILEIKPPTVIVDDNGNEKPRKAVIVVAGPKGGRLNISLPKNYWDNIAADVAAGNICAGMGVDNIGWKRMYDDNGNPILDENGQQRRTFYSSPELPYYYE